MCEVDGMNYVETEDCRVESFNEGSTTCQCGPQPPTPSPTVANVSSNGLTRKYRTLSLADIDTEDLDAEGSDYGFMTPQQRYKRLLAETSFSIQLTSTYTIISSPFIQTSQQLPTWY